ncbi:cytochrome c biogenesis CcdA family protein [Treponema sp. J25]|uniref:cytochrome c biogenesis CcdA family protein n=1 Tax=Treponema sp. J25 TaxID=2094121 RepID=UPI001053C562|nr:cytochrome c biogenesis CcdA family protein [Treponema sp. J25]TCW62252.1 hypothetical protein C5O22_01925 [Treponema sp. J25]
MAQTVDVFLAFIAGLLSFLSPCVFPLFPSYLAMLTGNTVRDLQKATTHTGIRSSEKGSEDREEPNNLTGIRRHLFARSLAFSAGFTVVFLLLGIVFSGTSAFWGSHQVLLNRIGGIVIIFLGIDTWFGFISFLKREWRIHPTNRPQGMGGAFLFGAAFGAGWSPCIGPILASILLMASRKEVVQAAFLLLSYSLGLASPFILLSLFLGQLSSFIGFLKKHMATIQKISGALLIGIGLFMFLGDLRSLSAQMVRLAYTLQGLSKTQGGVFRWLFTLLYFALALFFLWRTIKSIKQSPPFFHPRNLLRLVWTVLFFTLAILEGGGWFSSLQVFSSWLLFEGM